MGKVEEFHVSKRNWSFQENFEPIHSVEQNLIVPPSLCRIFSNTKLMTTSIILMFLLLIRYICRHHDLLHAVDARRTQEVLDNAKLFSSPSHFPFESRLIAFEFSPRIHLETWPIQQNPVKVCKLPRPSTTQGHPAKTIVCQLDQRNEGLRTTARMCHRN